MAVARLSMVTLETPRSALGMVLGRVIGFGKFHPSGREGMVQDVGILLLGSRAQAVSSQASELLRRGGIKVEGTSKEIETFEAHTVEGLVSSLEEYIEIIERNLSIFTEEQDRRGVVDVLQAVEEAAAMVFNSLQRILVYPPMDGRVKFEGYIPTKSVESFRALIGEYVISVQPVKTQTKNIPYVPTLLVNPRLISIFQDMTLQRGLPRYGEVDPTPILALAFPLFFGIMFGDIGHGIALLALGLYLVYRTVYKSWGKMVLVLSASTALFGFIRGSIFGVTFRSPLRSVIFLPPAFSAGFTLSYIPFLLEIAIVIGTFHIASAYAIAFINQERAGNYLDAFLNRLPTIVLYAFILPFGFAVVGTGLNLSVLFTSAAPTPVFDDLLGLRIPVSTTARVTLPVIAATIFFIVIGHPIREYLFTGTLRSTVRAFGAGIVDAVAKPFEFFINTLSYMRLGVLLITTTLLGSLVAGVLAYGALGIIIAVLLNVAVISLEGIIVYIQDMRLQLYEWLSQFYSGTGTPFLPLTSAGAHFRTRWT